MAFVSIGVGRGVGLSSRGRASSICGRVRREGAWRKGDAEQGGRRTMMAMMSDGEQEVGSSGAGEDSAGSGAEVDSAVQVVEPVPVVSPVQDGKRYYPSLGGTTILLINTYGGPVLPEGMTAPEPKVFSVEPDMVFNMLRGTVGTLARAGTGTFISGYTARIQDGKLLESSSTLPVARPELALELYEYEACPMCRKVREALSMLDIDHYTYPCPRGGLRFRPMVIEMGGKAQFPFLVDPNTGFSSYESDVLVKYLFEIYGDGLVPLTLNAGFLTTFSSGIASLSRLMRGGKRSEKVVYPEYPLTLWAYETSPFCKVVRERLCEYEVPYLNKTTPRGSPTRQEMIDKVGRFQVPYLEDPNTNFNMFESKFILRYLDEVYGPNAPNAVAELPSGLGLIKHKAAA